MENEIKLNTTDPQTAKEICELFAKVAGKQDNQDYINGFLEGWSQRETLLNLIQK